LIEAKADGPSTIVRVDGNLGYAFNQYASLKGGLNVMKFTSGDGSQTLNPGFGLQTSGECQHICRLTFLTLKD